MPTFDNEERGDSVRTKINAAISAVDAVSGGIVGTSASQTLTNKTIDADINTISNLAHGAEVDDPASGVHGVTGSIVGTSDAQTLTNKTVGLGSNTVSGTLAEFNTALSDDDFAGIAATQTLTNKTLSQASNTFNAQDGTRIVSLNDVAAVLADTTASYDTGTIIRTRAEGFAYEVQADDSTADLTTTAGWPAPLSVLPIGGVLHAEAFGVVVDDGTTDNAAALKVWRDAMVANGYHGKLPSKAGTIYSSEAITFPHTGSYYRMDTGLSVIGGGPLLKLTRKDTAASNFINTAETGTVVAPGAGITSDEGGFYINNTAGSITLTGNGGATIASDGLTEATREAAAEAFFAFYGSNYVIEGMFFEDCKRTIYTGQDPDQVGTENSHTSFLRISDIWAKNCSVGFTGRASEGSYYSGVRDVHVFQCQIGFDLGQMAGSIGLTHNFNRNQFENCRAARCQVGYWIRKGDTNTLIACHTEGIAAAPTNNRYTSPTGLPNSETHWSMINEGTKNALFSCVDEGSTKTLFSSDPEAVYLDTRYGESDAASTKVFFSVPPARVENAQTLWANGGQLSILSNPAANVFGTRPALFYAKSPTFEGNTTYLNTNTGNEGGWRRLYAFAPVASGGTASFTIWPEVVSGIFITNGAAVVFDVNVVGNSQTNNLVHNTKFRVLALRSSSSTLIRYHVLDVVGGVATGANTGAVAEQFTPALTVSGKNLVCTLTAPARTFEAVTVIVEGNYNRQ